MGNILIPHAGFAANPLTKGEIRNYPCVCGSGKKVKKCCGRRPFIPSDLAELFTAAANGDSVRVKELAEEMNKKEAEAVPTEPGVTVEDIEKAVAQ